MPKTLKPKWDPKAGWRKNEARLRETLPTHFFNCRACHYLTVEQLAELSEVSPEKIRAIEKGELSQVSLLEVIRLNAAMGNWSQPDEVLPNNRFGFGEWAEPQIVDAFLERCHKLGEALGVAEKKFCGFIADQLAAFNRTQNTKRIQEALFGDRHAWLQVDFDRYVRAVGLVEEKATKGDL